MPNPLRKPGEHLPFLVRPQGAPAFSETLRRLSLVAECHDYTSSTIEVLTNGDVFYEAELEAIGGAQESITLEAYIFHDSRVGRAFRDAMVERARNGVDVRLLVDAMGNWHQRKAWLQPLVEAGGHVQFFRRIPHLKRLTRRSHREQIVIDGRVAFIGGAGFNDLWLYPAEGMPPWRDTHFRVEGDAVAPIQAIFLRAWYEVTEELLLDPIYFHAQPLPKGRPGLVVNSRPGARTSAHTRILMRGVLEQARKRLRISTPYFAPNRQVLDGLIAAADRGVEVSLLTPAKSDHMVVQAYSRRLFHRLLQHGVRCYEYELTMMHAKTLLVDDELAVIGTMNLDHRSFGLNEELVVAAQDPGLVRRLDEDFQRDLGDSREFTMREWTGRSAKERLAGLVGSVIRKQL